MESPSDDIFNRRERGEIKEKNNSLHLSVLKRSGRLIKASDQPRIQNLSAVGISYTFVPIF